MKKQCISGEDLKKLLQWADEIQHLTPDAKGTNIPYRELLFKIIYMQFFLGKWLQYYQFKGEDKLLSRTENILPFFPELYSLFKEKVIQPGKDLIGDSPLVFKDKLIYKFPGSQGNLFLYFFYFYILF